MKRAVARLLLALPTVAFAAAKPDGEVVPLWSGVAPGSEGKTASEVVVETDGIRRVSSIHTPSIAVHLPSRKKQPSAAVIIMPGGGHRYLSIDNEGHKVAAWLNAHGVAGFVLKYRLAREDASTYKVAEHALADARRAVRLVRSRAKQWNVDPARVGILGFSAGGELATLAGSRFEAGKADAADPVERESSRPAFQGLLYSGMPADLTVPADAPPAFICTAADDKNPSKNALAIFGKLRDAGVEAELHVFARGGHGFGMKDRPYPVTAWAQRFYEWLGDQGFLAPFTDPPKPAQGEKPGEGERRALERQYAGVIRPLLGKYCVSCHGEKPKGELDLRGYATLASVAAALEPFAGVEAKVKSGEMPPLARKDKPAAPAPTAEERAAVVAFVQAVRAREAAARAGDPGPVLARRLSNAEYNYTIRDLTGVDLRPTREFPVDPTNPAGFDNSGESLALSPTLLKKYLGAAREVASHLVLGSEGLAFAPHPMLVETDRDKYCVGRIVDFYRRQNTDLAAYFTAAWRHKHSRRRTLAEEAAAAGLSPKYLATIVATLEDTRDAAGPLARLQQLWRKLPPPRRAGAACDGCVAMRDYVVGLRHKLEPRFTGPSVKGLPRTSQPLVMWRNRQYASHRMRCDRQALQIDGVVAAAGAPPKLASKAADDDDDDDVPPAPAGVAARDPDLFVPAADRARHEAAFDRFCAVFPDGFYVAERGRNYGERKPNPAEKGRLLSAGFHNLMGYFRDDRPLYDLLLDERQKAELDRLWRELDFVAAATQRTYLQFYYNGFGAAVARSAGKPADRDVTNAAAIEKLGQVYLARLEKDAPAAARAAVTEHFTLVNATLRATEQARAAAEPQHLRALLAFAERAYRRPLTPAEAADLGAYYKKLRAETHLEHDEAVRDVLVAVLMSPDFLYRIDLGAAPATGAGPVPLSDHALASRLSYFLWSSLPDERLLAKARAGELRRPEVLRAEAQRMLKDDRVRGLAAEFGGNWLEFRRFDQHNAVDRGRFPSFDDGLRAAMFEEPLRYLEAIMRGDRPVLDLVGGKDTYVNAALAKHYGMPIAKDAGDAWWRVADAGRYGRGGLLPMAAFLTKNAPGLRTSPVKRGYWVVKDLLGERIPPPPPVVPELPRDEAKLELPLREALAQHREDPACAGCHARFDALGLALEGYGPIGERRTQDLAGHKVDSRARFPGAKADGDGLPGLRAYVLGPRRDDFVDNLARKLLAYALGRSLLPSDDATVAEMKRTPGSFAALVETIVTSKQFLNRRGRETVAAR